MAQRELAVVLRDVDLGIWPPPRKEPVPTAAVDTTFHEFASDWFSAKRLEVEENTANHYHNDLTNHLLPFFKVRYNKGPTRPSTNSSTQGASRSSRSIG